MNFSSLDQEIEFDFIPAPEKRQKKVSESLRNVEIDEQHNHHLNNPDILDESRETVSNKLEDRSPEMSSSHPAVIFNPEPDGNCLFSAVSMDLFHINQRTKPETQPKAIRKAVSEYFLSEPEELQPFIPALEADFSRSKRGKKEKETTLKAYGKYISKQKTFGNHICLTAIIQLFDINFRVFLTEFNSTVSVMDIPKKTIPNRPLIQLLLDQNSEHYMLLEF